MQQVAHPTLIDTVENIGNTASAIANDPSIVPQAIGEAWDNKVEAYNNAQNDFERGFEIGTPFGELAPALTAAGSLGKAKTAEELATVGKTVGGYGDDLARGMGQYQRGSIGFADDAAGAGSKAKGSPLPVPEKTPVTTNSGDTLYYKSSTKHTAGQSGYSYKAGTEPTNSLDLFSQSVQSKGKRYTQDTNGNIHRFSPTNDGTWHWSGSTGDKSAPLKLDNGVKPDLQKQGMTGKVLK